MGAFTFFPTAPPRVQASMGPSGMDCLAKCVVDSALTACKGFGLAPTRGTNYYGLSDDDCRRPKQHRKD